MTRPSTFQITFYQLLDTTILMYFQETGSKIIIKKIPKHAFARFGVVLSQTPQCGYFSRCVLCGISSKALTMYPIADKNLS